MIYKKNNILSNKNCKHLASLALLGSACLPLTAMAQWIDIEPMNHLRFETAATQYNGDFYIFNGFGNGLSTVQSVERLDGDTLTWDVVSETSTLLSTAMTHNGLVRIGADVWLIGGRVGNTIADSVRIYNIDTGLWRTGPSLPVPVAAGGAVLANNQIHWIGGVDQNFECDLGHHFVYDLDDTDAGWQDITAVASMPEPRNHFSTVLFNGLIYTIGGQFGHGGCADINNGADTNLVHAYNPVTMTWTQVASLPQVNSHTEASTFAYEGAIYTIGGESSKQTILRYNPNTDTWDSLEPLPEQLVAPAVTVINGKLFVASGGAPNFRNPTNRARYTDMAPYVLEGTPAHQCNVQSNIASTGTASQSSNYRTNKFLASTAIDGNLNNFTHTAADNSANASPATWTLTFDQNNLISEVELINRSGFGGRLRDITVSVLTESGGVVYSTDLLNPENELNSPDTILVTLATPVLGRSIVVTRLPDPDLSGSVSDIDVSVLSLAEVNVEGCVEEMSTPIATCDVIDNLALTGEASQSSGYSGNRFPASNAIDDLLGNFTHTSRFDAQASLTVALQGGAILDEIVLHNRVNGVESRLRDITVTVHNDSGNIVYTSPLLNPENELGSPALIRVSLPAGTIGSSVSVARTPDQDLSGNNGAGNADEPNVLSLGELEIMGCTAPLF